MKRFPLSAFRSHVLAPAVALILALGPTIDLRADNGSALPYHAAPGTTVTLPAWQPNESPGTAQWYRNGVALAGQTGLRLTLPNVTAADSGTYRLVQSQPGFPDESSYFPLNIVAPPPTPADSTVVSALLGYGSTSGGWRVTGPRLRLADGRFVVGATFTDRLSAHWWSSLFFLRPDGSLIDSTMAGGYAAAGPIAILSSGRVLFHDTLPAELFVRYSSYISAVAEMPDGRILLAYQIGYGPPRLVRLRADYTVDPTFNSPVVPLGASQVLVDSAGRVLVWSAQGSDTSLLRFNVDGTPDPTFSRVTQEALWPASEVDGRPLTFSLLADDSLVAISRSPTTGDFSWRWLFRRIASDGSLPAGGRGSISESFAWSAGTASPVIDPQGRAYLLNRHGIWRYSTVGDDALDPTFYGGVDAATGQAWEGVSLLPDGRLLASRAELGTNGENFKVRFTTLRTTDLAPTLVSGTEVVSDQMRQNLQPGSRVVVTPTVFGTGPFTYQWLSLDGGVLPADSTSRTLVFENLTAANLGSYQVRVTGPGGTTLSGVVYLTPAYSPRLLALSGRGVIASGEETLIAGWNARSTGETLVRAVGPSLASYGVTGFAADPSLTVYALDGTSLLANDDWTPDLETTFAQTGAAPLLSGSKDAAAKQYLGGAQTLHLANRGGARGVALAEIYDSGNSAWSNRLLALSLRGFAGLNSETLTGGFVLEDPAKFDRPIRVLVRALGPTLTQYGLTHALTNPRLTIHRYDGSIVASNDNWSAGTDSSALAATMRSLGLSVPAQGSNDAALELDLPPGAYSAQITTADGTTGVALLEIYRVR